MSHYVIEKNLSTSPGQKATSGLISLLISSLLIFALWFMKITVPNPPFQNKTGELELDFGVVEEEKSFGAPDQGGPSSTPPAKGGENVEASSPTPSQTTTGGQGQVVNTTDPTAETSLPPIDPPESKTPQVNSRLAGALKIGKRGTGKDGIENGIEGGVGKQGFGDGGKVPGITGAGGSKVTNNRGNKLYDYKFNKYTFSSEVRQVNADGEGEIIAYVRVLSNGKARVLRIDPSSTYTGGDANAKEVMQNFIDRSRFLPIGDISEDQGKIKLTVTKRSLN